MTRKVLLKMRAKAGGVATLAALSMTLTTAGHADAVTEWNAVMQSTVATVNPFFQARSAAIVQLAVFEAVNAITGHYQPYLGTVAAPSGASPEAAAIVAAYRTLVTLHPGDFINLDAALAISLSAIPDGPAKDDGIQAGEAAAAAMLALRSNDGWDAVVPYTPGTAPGDWQPTPPAFGPAILTGWGRVETFGVTNAFRFRANRPPALKTGKYARHYDEVKEVGGADSPARPPDRAAIARFYIAAAVQFYNPAARQVSAAQGKTLSENARIFALLAMAVCDSLITCMESKYFYNYWRPVTAVVHADMDGNGKTAPDPTWLPLIVTPPFPSYPSAHASAGGAARAVLDHFYGEDGHFITLTSPTAPGVVLGYTTFEEITDDVDDARIYGGIHFRFDQEAGARQGRRIGSYILRNYLRPPAWQRRGVKAVTTKLD
jgi:hypothetical protein